MKKKAPGIEKVLDARFLAAVKESLSGSRKATLGIYLTLEEKETLQLASHTCGRHVSEWARDLLMLAARITMQERARRYGR